jgi:intracellular sulfur oxidation DsrE/DsrF family protein
MRFSKLFTSAALSLGMATGAHAEDPTKLITILTSADPQTQLMAMVLTMNAMNAGADAPASATTGQPPKDASPQGLIKLLMAQKNLRVQVCAIYLPAKRMDASVLLEGVTAAAPDAMGAAIVGSNTTVMSF